MEQVHSLLSDAMQQQSFVSALLHAPRVRNTDGPDKVNVRPLLLKGKRLYQFERHAGNKATHRNLAAPEAIAEIETLLRATFRQAILRTSEAEAHIVVNKKGEISLSVKAISRPAPDLRHNREKAYLLAEGVPHDFLVRLGVMTTEGKVVASRYDKFKQVNRFLEMVDDVVSALPSNRPLRIIDFGCGKSYLTFALYYYLTIQKKREVRVTGLDLKQDVITHCAQIAEDLGYENLTFEVGDIQGYSEHGDGAGDVDMVVSLHACDTATDDALAKAIGWNAKVILSVPCCQHELFDKIQSDALRPMLKHGIVKERLSSLITDSLRAQLLEVSGYSVQMLEFIEMEHTPKNILIRAVRKHERSAAPKQALQEYERFRDFWNLSPYLENLLGPTKPE